MPTASAAGPTPVAERRPLVVANCSGFYGDRLSAMREVLDGGPVDVVTGDYLAELTMLILGRQRLKDPSAGYARTFLTQLEDCLGSALERGVRIVSNAGGLHPTGLAAAVSGLAARLGLTVRVATVTGDDLLPRLGRPAAGGEVPAGSGRPTLAASSGGDDATRLDVRLGPAPPGGRPVEDATDATRLDVRLGPAPPGGRPVEGALTANAYLGCFGIARALAAGADVVVTGRVTDASLVVGPAAWHHGWTPADLDALAGATVAGHLLECGAQATGGNYSRFADLLDADPSALDSVGFPLAEVDADGSCVVTKHPGTGGAVTVGTVTEQLLYECTGAAYGGPDVVSRFDTVRLEQVGPDRVAVSGVRGEPPTGWLKVATNRLGGWRSSVTLPLTGLDVEAKAEVLRRQLAPALAGVASSSVALVRTEAPDADDEERASAMLHVSVRDPERDRVGRAFTGPLVELALASIPGFCTVGPPPSPTAYGVYEPAWVRADEVPQVVTLPDGTVEQVPSGPLAAVDEVPAGGAAAPPAVERAGAGGRRHAGAHPVSRMAPASPSGDEADSTPTGRAPLGAVVGARSGDKGGDATLGVWVRTADEWSWLERFLTVERLQQLLPETARLEVLRERLPNVRSLLFQVRGLLGEGVAASSRFDPQAKALGEWLRSRVVEIPAPLLAEAPATGSHRAPLPGGDASATGSHRVPLPAGAASATGSHREVLPAVLRQGQPAGASSATGGRPPQPGEAP